MTQTTKATVAAMIDGCSNLCSMQDSMPNQTNGHQQATTAKNNSVPRKTTKLQTPAVAIRTARDRRLNAQDCKPNSAEPTGTSASKRCETGSADYIHAIRCHLDEPESTAAASWWLEAYGLRLGLFERNFLGAKPPLVAGRSPGAAHSAVWGLGLPASRPHWKLSSDFGNLSNRLRSKIALISLAISCRLLCACSPKQA